MSMRSPRPLLATFLPSVNALLAALALPFTIDHPTDLTPSLLLAIFESLISARLPIPPSVRQSRTPDAKARAMLVLLGVLECDVLRGGTATNAEHSITASNADDSGLGGTGGVSVDGWVDEIGLGEVDPERLADGGWDETIFVGELLCWLARRNGVFPRTKSLHRSSHPRSLCSYHHSYGTEEGEHEGNTTDFSTSLLLRPPSAQRSRSPRPSPSTNHTDPDSSAISHITDVPRHPLVYSPEPSLSASVTTGTDLSIRARSISSRTSVSNIHDEFEEASQDTVQMYDPRQLMQDAEDDDDQPPTFRPRCIHELEDPSYIRALAGPSTFFSETVSHQHVSEDGPSADEDEYAGEQDNDDPYAPSTPTPRPVRLSGWIDTVDPAIELSQFTAFRSHPRSFTFNMSADLGPGPSFQFHPQTWSHKDARMDELPRPTTRLKTELPGPASSKPHPPRRASSSPSTSPSLPPSSKHPPSRSSPSPPPPPPAHSDPPFDVSFSTLNNTSTPAKLRQPRRPQFQTTTTRNEITHGVVDKATTETGRLRRRGRSPFYTPTPPSFSTPGSSQDAWVNSTQPSDSKTRPGASATTPTPPFMATATKKRTTSTSPLATSGAKDKDKSPPPGSTAATNTLLTERARLLTELAALKRARAASSSGTRMDSMSGVGMGSSGGGGGSGVVVSRRVGVGVRT